MKILRRLVAWIKRLFRIKEKEVWHEYNPMAAPTHPSIWNPRPHRDHKTKGAFGYQGPIIQKLHKMKRKRGNY